jgi:hypothetical protein
MELGGPAHIPQTTFALFDGLKAQAVAVEAPRAVEVLRRKLGHGARCAEWTRHGGELPPLIRGMNTSRDRLIPAMLRTHEAAPAADSLAGVAMSLARRLGLLR